ncbi:MAG: hypothetical protein AMJ62_01755 [Myxococcales bacterium SG8_38]|nr:MAG: hypothetical protein AMJ62_01755 [Myxococcales bacterium SG8_38]
MCLILCVLDVTATVQAQQVADHEPQEEEQPEEPASPTGALPLEDPTIQPERESDLRVSEEPEGDTSADEGERPAAEPEEEATAEQTTGELPVEDPTIVEPAKTEEEEEVTKQEKSAEPPTKGPEEERGSNVKVVYDQGFLLAVDDWFYLALAGLMQARYTVNYRTKPPTDPDTAIREKQVSEGFDVPRARFQLGIGLTQFVALYMRIGVVAGGNFSFQRAFIDLKWKYFRIRAGLFMNETDAESLVNPEDLYMLDYSIAQNVYDPGSSKGVMFTYLRKRFSINLGYSDGLRTGFAEIREPVRADFAVTLRTQYGWGEGGLAGFNRLTARRGTPFGVRLGAALHYQDGGRSQGTLPVQIMLGTIDLSLRGSGWSLLLTLIAGQDATNQTETNEAGEVISAGVVLTGGYFVLENLQVFGVYSIVAKPRVQGTLPPNVPPEFAATENFQEFGVGLSYFVVPGRNNVKLSSDFQYFLGRQTGSIVPTSPLNAIQPNDAGSQFAWRVQLTAAF